MFIVLFFIGCVLIGFGLGKASVPINNLGGWIVILTYNIVGATLLVFN